MKFKKIFLTGGSGFIGSHYHDVVEHNRIVNFDLVKPKFQNNSTFIQGDVREFEQIDAALIGQNCDVILSLAAEHKDFGISREMYFKTNEYGTEMICKAANKHNIKSIIFYSSVAVYGNNTTPSSEEMTPSPSNDYGASKLAGEEVLRKWEAESEDRSVLIIRPVVVYGERNIANMYRLINQINKGRYFHIGKGKNVKSIAYVKNLVGGTIHLANKMKPGVATFNYADEPQLSSRKIADVIAEELDNKRLRTLPYPLVYTMGLPFDFLIWVTKKDLPISTNRVKKFCTETYHRAEKIRNAGFQPQFTNVQGLQAMVKWFQYSTSDKVVKEKEVAGV